ncbi:hypothetical protein LPJ72_003701 [Coemansia sp. Benny D160-2]|nr:hypothetical protein LPJ72_003701 [Coemansia sp. Benny D160-2]
MSKRGSDGSGGSSSSSVGGDFSNRSSGSGSEYESETDHVPEKRQKTEDDSTESQASDSPTNKNLETLSSVEHKGRIYYVGDHAILEDTDNVSGTKGTELPAVGHIQSIQREEDTSVSVTVAWYVFPQLTPHPSYMEFYQNAVLRTFRQTTVPVDRIGRKCFVVEPTDAMSGHPSEWTEADGDLYVCDLRFVDKGAFIKKIKNWSSGYWPADMAEDRHKMLTTMVPWDNGPRELQKAPVPVPSSEDDSAHTPQTRRTTRMAATPKSSEVAPQNGNGDTESASAPGLREGQINPMTPTPAPSSQAQLFAYQQLLSQGRINMPAGMNGQTPPSFVLPDPSFNPAMLSPQQQMQLIQQTQNAQGHAMPGSLTKPAQLINGAVTNPQFQPSPTPRRRGRPPKNKQLIQQRAMEDAAAAAAAAAAGGVPVGAMPSIGVAKAAQVGIRSSTRARTPSASAKITPQRQNSMYSNVGRPPPSPSMYNGMNGMTPSIQRMSSSGSGLAQAMYHPSGQMQAGSIQGGAQMNQARMYAPQQQQLQQPQQQMAQQQKNYQQQAPVEYLPYTDPSSTPQLPKEVVDMFPTANGRIKWFATAPALRQAGSCIQHSDAYLRWEEDSKHSHVGTKESNHMDVDTASASSGGA